MGKKQVIRESTRTQRSEDRSSNDTLTPTLPSRYLWRHVNYMYQYHRWILQIGEITHCIIESKLCTTAAFTHSFHFFYTRLCGNSVNDSNLERRMWSIYSEQQRNLILNSFRSLHKFCLLISFVIIRSITEALINLGQEINVSFSKTLFLSCNTWFFVVRSDYRTVFLTSFTLWQISCDSFLK